MKKVTKMTFLASLITILGVVGFNNCDLPSQGLMRKQELVVTGNPFAPSMKIIGSACHVLLKAHPEITSDQCQNGVLSTSFSNSLGVPPQRLDPFYNLVAAEQAGAINADALSLDACLTLLDGLDPQSPQVRGAYDSNSYNPFLGVAAMIPSDPTGCPKVYSGNSFAVPTPSPTPPPGTVVVTFDDFQVPNPASQNFPILGIFQGLDFGGTGSWVWSLPYGPDSTDVLVPDDAFPMSFNFSGGAKILDRIDFFANKSSGVVTMTDDLGQTVMQSIPMDSQMHTVVTGFSKASNSVSIDFPVKSGLGMDNIVYRTPSNPFPIAYIQSNVSAQHPGSSVSTSFINENLSGDLIVAQAIWLSGASCGTPTDSSGNIYFPASALGTSPLNAHQQIFYAKNIKGGPNQVTLSCSGSDALVLYVFEYSGLDRVNPLDSTVTVGGTALIADSGPVTTHFPNELIFVGVRAYYSVLAPTIGYTVRSRYENNLSEDLYVSSPGTYNATVTMDGNDWTEQVVTFR